MPAGLTLVLTNNPEDPSNPLANPTLLGTELTLKFTLVELDYKFFEVTSLIADDCDEGSGYEISLVDEGCLTAFAKSIIKEFDNTITGTDDNDNPLKIMYITFDAFKFSGESNSVCFTAEAAICENDVFPCTRELCTLVVLILLDGPLDRQLSNGGDAKRRKRRDTFTFQTEEFAGGSLKVGYTAQDVEPRAAQQKRPTSMVYDKTRCMQGMAFILPLVVMALMLVVSMVTTFSFSVRSGGKTSSFWRRIGSKNSSMISSNMSQMSDPDAYKNLSTISDMNQDIMKDTPIM